MEIVDIFQNFGFPIAVSVVLFFCLYKIFATELKRNEVTSERIFKLYSEQINFAEKQIEKLTFVISENTKAYTALIEVLQELKNTLK